MPETAPFDQAGEQFVGYYETVRGYVRQEVTRRNLLEWLPDTRGLDVLDFGGGDGRDAIWLAGLGDQVTLLDESSGMIEKAKTNLKSAPPQIKSAVRPVHGNLAELLDADESFDAVLSHGVLMYELDDPLGQLRRLASMLRQGGLLSLLTKGREAARSQLNDGAARAEFDKRGQFTNRLKQPARAYDFAELEQLLAETGLQVVAEYGVRVLSDTDRRALKDVSETELAEILDQEADAGRDPAKRSSAQMLHVMAIKD